MTQEHRFLRRLPLWLALLLVAMLWMPQAWWTGSEGETGPKAQRQAQPSERPATAEQVVRAKPPVRSQRSGLSGHILNRAGQGLGDELVRVDELVPKAGKLSAERVPRARMRTEADGSFQAEIWTGRRYVVSVDPYRYAQSELTVSVEHGDRPLVSLTLDRLPGAGSVSGLVRSETGRWHGPVQLTLAPDQRTPTWSRDVHWEQQADGLWLGRFAFEDVPWDHYTCRLIPKGDDLAEWTALELSAMPPASKLEFVRLDADESIDLAFHPYDEQTGQTIEDFELCVSYESGLQGARCQSGQGAIDLLSVPRNDRLRWSLSASGYQQSSGNLDGAFERGPKLRFTVPLARRSAVRSQDKIRRHSGLPASP